MEAQSNIEQAGKNQLYPVFLKLEKLHTLLVGGGNVGLEKLSSLLTNTPTATITVVAPLIREELKTFASDFANVILINREFRDEDLEGKDLVICATDNKELHAHVKKIANDKKLLVNVADTPPLCDFYLGSIVQKGQLKIAISTNGYSPTIAKRVKEVLQNFIPDEIDRLLYNMQQVRDKMNGDFAQKVKELNELTETLISKHSNV